MPVYVIDLQCLVDTSQSSPGVVNLSSRRPLGVAGPISPWNLPLYLLTFKVVLQKVPSELHPKVRNHGEGPS